MITFHKLYPPPLAKDKVNNTYIWLLSCTPILIAFIEILFELDESNLLLSILLYLIANSLFAYLDEQSLKLAGHRHINFFSATIFVPYYLWKRASYFKEPQKYIACWVFFFIISGAGDFVESSYQEYIDLAKETNISINYNPVESIKLVKYGTLYQYPSKPIGATFEKFLTNTHWKTFITDENQSIVEMTAKQKGDDIVVQFAVNQESFDVSYIGINQHPLNKLELYDFIDDKFSLKNDLELINHKMDTSSLFMQLVTGTAVNKSNMPISNISITFSLYDTQGNIVGEATDYIEHLPKKAKWKFTAPILIIGDSKPVKAKLLDFSVL